MWKVEWIMDPIFVWFRERERESEMGSVVEECGSASPRSPEAKLGMKVEDLWDTQEAQLSPTEKLNACFESIPVSAFPPAPQNQGLSLFFLNVRVCVVDGLVKM